MAYVPVKQPVEVETVRTGRGFKVGDWVRERSEAPVPGENLWLVVREGLNYYLLMQPGSHGGYSWHRLHFDNIQDYELVEESKAKALIQDAIRRIRVEMQRTLQGLLDNAENAGVRLLPSPGNDKLTGTELVPVTSTPAEFKRDLKQLDKQHGEVKDRIRKLAKDIEGLCMYEHIRLYGDLEQLKALSGVIDRSLQAVDLYGGISEDLVLVRDGKPANNGKITVFRSRLYMDEECIIGYKAGGINIETVERFDRWLARDGNFKRILPMPRCIVAFRVRRDKRRFNSIDPLESFIRLRITDADKTTFLYIRDGGKLWRLNTCHDFGETLFPGQYDELYGGAKLWVTNVGFTPEVVTDRERREQLKDKWNTRTYYPLDWSSVYLEDGLAALSKRSLDYNKFAVILQGLIDRGVIEGLPRIKLWNPDDFNQWIQLVDDYGYCLPQGPEPDFEQYRERLQKLIKPGIVLTGQYDYWLRHEALKENRRQERDYRCKHPIEYVRFAPYGNPGPPDPAVPVKLSSRGARFEWTRDSLNYTRWDDKKVKCSITVPLRELLNVSDYKPGDYLRFYRDPRTRRKYLEWAYLMLAAEDWHHKQDGK